MCSENVTLSKGRKKTHVKDTQIGRNGSEGQRDLLRVVRRRGGWSPKGAAVSGRTAGRQQVGLDPDACRLLGALLGGRSVLNGSE